MTMFSLPGLPYFTGLVICFAVFPMREAVGARFGLVRFRNCRKPRTVLREDRPSWTAVGPCFSTLEKRRSSLNLTEYGQVSTYCPSQCPPWDLCFGRDKTTGKHGLKYSLSCSLPGSVSDSLLSAPLKLSIETEIILDLFDLKLILSKTEDHTVT